MKPLDQGGVVDERLNVYGIENLKVAGTAFFSHIKIFVTHCVFERPEHHARECRGKHLQHCYSDWGKSSNPYSSGIRHSRCDRIIGSPVVRVKLKCKTDPWNLV